jgi:hypothetical protein
LPFATQRRTKRKQLASHLQFLIQARRPQAASCTRIISRSRGCSKEPSQVGIAFVSGAAFYFDGERNTLRLSYSFSSEQEIGRGIARLARLI